MITMKELVERVRKAPGATRYLRVQAVLLTITPEEMQVAAGFGLLVAESRLLKQSNVPERAVPGMPRGNPLAWRKIEFEKWGHYAGVARRSYSKLERVSLKIAATFKSEAETYRDVRKRLDPETRAWFEKWVRIRQLAA